MEALLGIALGIGLAAAAGLRVFVPVFGAGLAAHFGALSLNQGFAWVATLPALVAFGTATILEIGAYYVPWLDHALDVAATPTAVAAGILSSAAVITDLPPLLTWTIAIVLGGGAAGIMQLLSVATRIKSAVTTGGLGNPVVATAETAGSIAVSALAIAVPAVALLILAVVAVWLVRRRQRRAVQRASR
ncbi:MAG: DUF4126 domain-containing protein [Gemmatimonadaceae bacterium]